MQIWVLWLWYLKQYIVLPIVLAFSPKGSFPNLKIVAVCLNNQGTYVDDRFHDLVAQNLLVNFQFCHSYCTSIYVLVRMLEL